MNRNLLWDWRSDSDLALQCVRSLQDSLERFADGLNLADPRGVSIEYLERQVTLLDPRFLILKELVDRLRALQQQIENR